MTRRPHTRLVERSWFAAAPIFPIAIAVAAWQQERLPHGWWAAPIVAIYCLYQGSLSRLRRFAREREARDR